MQLIATLPLVRTLLGISVPGTAAQVPTADLSMQFSTSRIDTILKGQPVKFKVTVRNLGPDTVTISMENAISDSLIPRFSKCGHGGYMDGPYCVFENVAPGEQVTRFDMAYVFINNPDEFASGGTCASVVNGTDTNTGNNCGFVTLTITDNHAEIG